MLPSCPTATTPGRAPGGGRPALPSAPPPAGPVEVSFRSRTPGLDPGALPRWAPSSGGLRGAQALPSAPSPPQRSAGSGGTAGPADRGELGGWGAGLPSAPQVSPRRSEGGFLLPVREADGGGRGGLHAPPRSTHPGQEGGALTAGRSLLRRTPDPAQCLLEGSVLIRAGGRPASLSWTRIPT